MRSSLMFAVLSALAIVPCADAQQNRRDRQDPELVIESGGRMGACDCLMFTDDGKQLLAVGDDKVVRIWDLVDGRLQPAERPVLRWGIWREQRGAIYALALSPDPENKYVAIGGLGAVNTTVTVLDRASGEVVHSVAPVMKGQNFYAVWSVAFAPSGKRIAFGTGDGSVLIWDFKTYRWCGRHTPKYPSEVINTVRLVRFLDEDTILSVAEDGTVNKWDTSTSKITRTELKPLTQGNQSLIRVAMSANKKWLAAATKGPLVVVRSLSDNRQIEIPLKDGEFPRSIAFDPRHDGRLAVSVGSLVPGGRFHVEANDQIRFYDAKGAEPKGQSGPPHTYRAEFLAWHPTQDFLAIAGGDNQEVTLWDFAKPAQPSSVMRGVGSCLWGVALSEDGDQVAFQDNRDPKSADPNKRGTGDWRVFDLPRRQYREPADFKPVAQLTQADGWHIETDAGDPYQLIAVGPGDKRFALPRFPKQEGMPRCFTFIKADGKSPTRVAVGHYWGLSLYELTPDGARRTRVFAGHQGEVTAIAVSADHQWLVSASNDQTIAAWNIADTYPSNPILGAKFALENGRLLVKKVDVGSPAWEAGLIENDEVVLFAFNGKDVPGGKEAWLKRLQDPVPGLEHYFEVRRGGHKLSAGDRARFGLLGGVGADWVEGRTVAMLTTVRQRPLWRFFPTRDNEWALWMWRNSFYDCSTKGDSYIGWHVNAPDLDHAPTYYRAEQFRKVLERPDVIDKLLQTRDVRAALREVSENPMPLSFDKIEPPAVTLEVGATSVTDQPVNVKVFATAIGSDPDYQPERAELWLNDYRLQEWKNLAVWAKEGNRYSLQVVVPNEKLRSGRNVLTFQTYNHLGGRAETAGAIDCKRPAGKPHLFGLSVGVNDYSSAKTTPGSRNNLQNLTSASADATGIEETWAHPNPLYDGKPQVFVRLDKTAKRAEILKALDDLAQKVGPDDNCVLFMAGHGLFLEPKPAAGEAPHSTFVFCGPDFDLARPTETGISSEVLYDKLAAIPGHKVVILDACHSGEAAANPVRGLVPGGQGPVIMAACDRNQFSYENKDLGHGLFTYAILQALGDGFKDADADHNGELDAAEIYQFTRKRMPELLKQIKQKEHVQVPIMFTPSGPLVPLARMKDK